MLGERVLCMERSGGGGVFLKHPYRRGWPAATIFLDVLIESVDVARHIGGIHHVIWVVDKVVVPDVKYLGAKEPIEDMEVAVSRRALKGTERLVLDEKLVWVDEHSPCKLKFKFEFRDKKFGRGHTVLGDLLFQLLKQLFLIRVPGGIPRAPLQTVAFARLLVLLVEDV